MEGLEEISGEYASDGTSPVPKRMKLTSPKRMKLTLPKDHKRVWIQFGGYDIPPIAMWVNFKANIYELKKEILSDTNVLPKEFKKILPYDLTVYCQGNKIEDFIIVEDTYSSWSNPLILMNEEFARHLKSGDVSPSGVHKYNTQPLCHLVQGVVSQRDFLHLVQSKKRPLNITDATDEMKQSYLNVRNHINCCEPLEIALLPIITNLVAISLGPKQCMAIPCFVTKEEKKRRGPSYHTDVTVAKMESVQSSYVRVAIGMYKVLMVIEMKMNVATQLHIVPLKDILELLVYLVYVMQDNHVTKICGVLSDIKMWHCFHVKMNEEGKLEILDYIHYQTDEEITLLGFLPSLVQSLELV